MTETLPVPSVKCIAIVQAFLLLQVSWIRRWDWHILTTGIYTYTKDMRFRVLHPEGSDDWTLQLKYVETKDNGTYECQMYTGTGVLSQFVNLHVNTPRAVVLGPQELHVQEGDTITLVCVIQQSKPPFVFWYHGDQMVNYDGSRNRLNVITQVEGSRTNSRLTITDARYTDSGNYSCLPPNVKPAYVLVFVSQAGDTVAADRLSLPPLPPPPPNLHRHGRGATPRRALLEDWHRSRRSHGRGKARALCGGHRHALFDHVYADVLYVCPVSRAGPLVAEDLRFLIKDCHNLHGLDFLVSSRSILDLDSRALTAAEADMEW
ncbi:Neuronal cell adhesion molecule [Penaeus vannamei]|uniref:Neuronal cell adhesion molecule n=1 Tax=Penaeus vannamei TaxID=6689 RepID=A0A3R7MQ18_PENVA|nr:Neuronal cell adhesion molecule [Penaeus vannamei]